jgi:autotransporter-associated beta strand protein
VLFRSVFNRNNAITQGTHFASVIAGNGNVIQNGSGTLTLTGNNTYTGGTTVSAGTLLVDTGASVATSTSIVNGGLLRVNGTAGSVTVNGGGSLGGSGTVGALTLNSGGLLNPGNSPGILTAASAIVLGGSTYNWQISALEGTAGTNWDLLSVTTLLDMSGVTSLNKWNLVITGDSGFTGWTGTSEYSYVFAQAASVSGFSATVGTDVTDLFNITVSGINSLPNASANVNGAFKVEVGSAGDLTTLKLMAIPEPSTGALLGLEGFRCGSGRAVVGTLECSHFVLHDPVVLVELEGERRELNGCVALVVGAGEHGVGPQPATSQYGMRVEHPPDKRGQIIELPAANLRLMAPPVYSYKNK